MLIRIQNKVVSVSKIVVRILVCVKYYKSIAKFYICAKYCTDRNRNNIMPFHDSSKKQANCIKLSPNKILHGRKKVLKNMHLVAAGIL